ncbi:MAG: hypothetical protein ACE3L7_04050 [Candidatus Pristimantibacillus sp.]
MQKPTFFNHFGLWDVENITIEYISKSWVQITCSHLVTNGEHTVKNIHFTIIDRLKGVNFDSKVSHEIKRFAKKMEKRNSHILDLRERSRKARNAYVSK